MRKSTLQSLKGFFGLSQMAGIINGLTVGIGVEVSQSNIKTNGFTCGFSLLDPFNVKTKLDVVPVSFTNNSNSLASASTGRNASHGFPTV